MHASTSLDVTSLHQHGYMFTPDVNHVRSSLLVMAEFDCTDAHNHYPEASTSIVQASQGLQTIQPSRCRDMDKDWEKELDLLTWNRVREGGWVEKKYNPIIRLVPSCFVIFDLEPLSLYFDFVFSSKIFKSLSFSLDHLFHLAILCLDQHAHTLHHLESSLIISPDNRCFDSLDNF
ncbi:hypothetical protein Tco_1377100 [Tanacetum coccineum]